MRNFSSYPRFAVAKMCLHSLGDTPRKGPNTQRKYSATCTYSLQVRLFKQREVLLLIQQSATDWTRDKRGQRTIFSSCMRIRVV